MNLAEPTIIRRADDVGAIKRLIVLSRTGCHDFQALAMGFNAAGWNEVFIKFWQQEAANLAELEDKLRTLGGGVLPIEPEIVEEFDDPETTEDPISHDKQLVACCLNQKHQILQAYAEIRHYPMSFDVRMMIYRHQIQALDMAERLTVVYRAYPSRSTSPNQNEKGSSI